MKHLIISITCLMYFQAYSQNLKKSNVSKADALKGVTHKYEFNDTESFYRIVLWLFKNGRYKYILNSFNQDLLSEGKWEISGRILKLNSDIKKDNVPASFSLNSDTSYVDKGFKFDVVRNFKGKFLTDVFINVNSDSVKCLPAAAFCTGTYKSIDSVRLQFENGFTSKWMKVPDIDVQHIFLKVDTDVQIASYFAFDDFKYLLGSKEIKAISKQ